MSGFQWKAINSIGAIVGVALMLQDLAIAQSQTTTTQIDKPNRVSVAYVATKDLVLQEAADSNGLALGLSVERDLR